MQSKACFSYAPGAKEENKRSLLIGYLSMIYIKELPCGEALFFVSLWCFVVPVHQNGPFLGRGCQLAVGGHKKHPFLGRKLVFGPPVHRNPYFGGQKRVGAPPVHQNRGFRG